MHRLTITEYIITIAILLTLALAGSWILRSWLLNVQAETTRKIERVNY